MTFDPGLLGSKPLYFMEVFHMYLVIEIVGKGQSHPTLTFLQSQNVLSSHLKDIKNKKSGFGSVAKSMCSLELLGFC